MTQNKNAAVDVGVSAGALTAMHWLQDFQANVQTIIIYTTLIILAWRGILLVIHTMSAGMNLLRKRKRTQARRTRQIKRMVSQVQKDSSEHLPEDV